MKNYKLILFDWDGCLAKNLDLWLEVYKQVFLINKLHPSEKEIIDICFGNQVGPSLIGIKNLDEFYQNINKILLTKYPACPLNSNAINILNYLNELNKVVGLVTSSFRKKIEDALKYNNIQQLFNFTLTYDEVKKQKPDPAIIIKSLEISGLSKAETVIIGDSPHDIDAARNAGIDSILYFPLRHKKYYQLSELKKSKPTFIIKDFTEIKTIIK